MFRRPIGLLLLATAILAALFYRSFLTGQALFSNDGPLGIQVADANRLPAAFLGIWNNLNWVGSESGHYSPNISGLIQFVFGPYGYVNFHAPLALLFLAFVTWVFVRELGLGGTAATIVGLAAMLNGNFFSNACWGLSTRALSLAMTFLALTAVHSSFGRFATVKTILAGLAVGLSISEGGDNGAIFSLVVAAYSCWMTMLQMKPLRARLIEAFGRVALMAGVAGILSAQILAVFVSTAVQGIDGTAQTSQSREQRWEWATQWSLPKIETLRVIVPGLFGYRMDSEDGGQYWGAVGQTPDWHKMHNNPHWLREHPGAIARHSGAGEYAGLLVVIIAVWAVVNSRRRSGMDPFSTREQRLIWFWTLVAALTLLLSWGRHAPLYQLVYALPYISTVRNPMKFMHPFHLASLILFAYGLQGILRTYFLSSNLGGKTPFGQWRLWCSRGFQCERIWLTTSIAAVGVAALAYVIISSEQFALAQYLISSAFSHEQAIRIAQFSTREIGLFVSFLFLSLAFLAIVQTGYFAGARAKWGVALLIAILGFDLWRANVPWLRYYDYKIRYAINPVLEVLRNQPFQHRVTMPAFHLGMPFTMMQQYYHAEWLQHHFPYYNIQSLDVAQEPRIPTEKRAYLHTLERDYVRLLTLTNTRYILGLAGQFVETLNDQLDPHQRRFHIHSCFEILTLTNGSPFVRTNETGPFALLEFTGALPRTKLYSQWRLVTDDEASRQLISDVKFSPYETVVVTGDDLELSSSSMISKTNGNSGVDEATIVDYAPTRIIINTRSSGAAMLLLNEKHDPNWTATVDGRSVKIHRANYLMRAVLVPAGEHKIEFSFQPRRVAFWATLSTSIAGLCLTCFLAIPKIQTLLSGYRTQFYLVAIGATRCLRHFKRSIPKDLKTHVRG